MGLTFNQTYHPLRFQTLVFGQYTVLRITVVHKVNLNCQCHFLYSLVFNTCLLGEWDEGLDLDRTETISAIIFHSDALWQLFYVLYYDIEHVFSDCIMCQKYKIRHIEGIMWLCYS